MSEEERLKRQIADGKDADSWLNHPVYRNAIQLLKAKYILAFEQTKFDEPKKRDEIWRKMQALTALTQDLERVIADASRAEHTLMERIKAKMKR